MVIVTALINSFTLSFSLSLTEPGTIKLLQTFILLQKVERSQIPACGIFSKIFYKNIEVYECYGHFNHCSYPGVDLFKCYLNKFKSKPETEIRLGTTRL